MATSSTNTSRVNIRTNKPTITKDIRINTIKIRTKANISKTTTSKDFKVRTSNTKGDGNKRKTITKKDKISDMLKKKNKSLLKKLRKKFKLRLFPRNSPFKKLKILSIIKQLKKSKMSVRILKLEQDKSTHGRKKKLKWRFKTRREGEMTKSMKKGITITTIIAIATDKNLQQVKTLSQGILPKKQKRQGTSQQTK